MLKTQPCTLVEMLVAMSKLPDETVFRWFTPDETGRPYLCLTLGQLRRETAKRTS